MPFDGQLDPIAADLAKLRMARDGIAGKHGWATGRLGLMQGPHCVLGWLYFVTDNDPDETTRLAVDYLYPALPAEARESDGVMASIYRFNDDGTHKRVVALFDDAISRAG